MVISGTVRAAGMKAHYGRKRREESISLSGMEKTERRGEKK